MANQFKDSMGRPIVVVTGMGVVTSLGQGKEDNWKKLTSGVSGIHRITRFPIDGLKTVPRMPETMAWTPTSTIKSARDQPFRESVWLKTIEIASSWIAN